MGVCLEPLVLTGVSCLLRLLDFDTLAGKSVLPPVLLLVLGVLGGVLGKLKGSALALRGVLPFISRFGVDLMAEIWTEAPEASNLQQERLILLLEILMIQ